MIHTQYLLEIHNNANSQNNYEIIVALAFRLGFFYSTKGIFRNWNGLYDCKTEFLPMILKGRNFLYA